MGGWDLLTAFNDGSKLSLMTNEIPTNAAIVSAMKAEILSDIDAGTVPASVTSFSELHDYVDANMYADELLSAREESGEPYLDFINAVTDEVDAWLQAGRPSAAPPRQVCRVCLASCVPAASVHMNHEGQRSTFHFCSDHLEAAEAYRRLPSADM